MNKSMIEYLEGLADFRRSEIDLCDLPRVAMVTHQRPFWVAVVSVHFQLKQAEKETK